MGGQPLILVTSTLPPAALRARLEAIRGLYPDKRLLVVTAGDEGYGAEVDTVRLKGPYIGLFRGLSALRRVKRLPIDRVIIPYAGADGRGYLNAHLAACYVKPTGCFGMTVTGEEIPVTLLSILAGMIRSLVSLVFLFILAIGIAGTVARGRLRRRRNHESGEKTFLLLSYYFPPQGGPAVQRPLSFARHLPAFGWRPVVIAGNPADTIARDDTLSGEVPEGTMVLRPGLEESGERWVRRFRDLPRPLRHVPDQYLGWVHWAVKTALSDAVGRMSPRAVMASAPPYSSFLAARAIAAASGLPAVLDYRDSWTGEGPEKSFTRLSRFLETWLERWVLSGDGPVTVVARRLKGQLAELKPDIDRRRLVWLPNGFEPADFVGLEPRRPDRGEIVLYYMGSFFGRRSPEALFGVLARLLAERPELASALVLAFAGRESGGIREWALEHGVAENVVTLGYLDHRTALSYLLGSNGAILLVGENLPGLVPGKIYEYMAAGKPIFAMAPPHGEAARYLRRYGRGVVVTGRSEQDVTRALGEFIDRLPRWGSPMRAGFARAFDRSRVARRLARILDGLERTGPA